MKHRTAFCLCVLLSLTGCSNSTESTVVKSSEKTEEPVQTSDTEFFSDRDLKQDYDTSEAQYIDLNTSDDITITQEGVYVFSGTLSDGMITVNASDTAKVQIVLENADITSSKSTCIYVESADKVFLTVIGENSLKVTAGNDEKNDGAVYCTSDLTLNGTGTLSINNDIGHGIVSKDDLAITGGTYDFNISGHGFKAQEHIAIQNSVFSLVTGKDGFHSENEDDTTEGLIYIVSGTFDMTCGGDGLDASGTVEILDGDFTVVCGGGSGSATMKTETAMKSPWGFDSISDLDEDESLSSMKGIKSDQSITIHNGTFNMDCYDDFIHSNENITIEDGTFTLQSGDDGIHADNRVTLNNGTYTISWCYEGIEGMIVTIEDGTYDITSNDDGINASSSISTTPGISDNQSLITINGGNITVVSGGDSIDSNGDLVVNGGTLNLTCQSNGNTAIDTDGSYTNNGGDVTTNDGSENGTGMMGGGNGMMGGKGGMGGSKPNDRNMQGKGTMPDGEPDNQMPADDFRQMTPPEGNDQKPA